MKKEAERDEFIRKRAQRQKKIRKRRLTVFFIIFIIILLCVAAVLSLTVFFPIKNITVVGSEIYSEAEILDACQISKGDNLFVSGLKNDRSGMHKKLPFVESITYERKIPDTLKIIVKDAVEFACYKVDDKYYTVSSSGWVLDEKYELPENLICINSVGVDCKVGSEINFEDISQKQLIDSITEALSEQSINVELIDVTNPIEIILRVENRFEVNLGTQNNISEKIRHLNAMIKEIPEEKSGEINLGVWSSNNTKGIFTANN